MPVPASERKTHSILPPIEPVEPALPAMSNAYDILTPQQRSTLQETLKQMQIVRRQGEKQALDIPLP